MIGSNLQRLMEKKGLSGKELSELAKVSENQISKIKNNKADPSAAIVKRLAISLECTSDNLLFSEEDLEPDQEMKMIFKELEKLPEEKKALLREVIRAVILKTKSEQIKEL